MTRRPLLLALVLVLLPGAAEARQRPYVDPALRALMRADAQAAEAAGERERADGAPRRMPAVVPFERPDALGQRPASPFSDLALDRSAPGGRVRVGVLVRLREPVQASLAALRATGARVGTVVGNIATARVPLDALPRLTALADVESVEAARRLSLLNDSSMKAIRAAEVRKRDGDAWYGSAGHGVIVGLYDTGVDYLHGDFRDGTGRSRILGIWDMSRGGTPPAGYFYGSYCDGASLDARTCPQRDFNGHGTHVLGTAAGDGSAAGLDVPYVYAGVAPAADLLVVKGGGFTADEIIDGVNWIFETAEALGRPAVVNLSLGLQWGARDGTSLFEQALDGLSGPGRIIVVAAGNNASNGNTEPGVPDMYMHAMATPAGAGTPVEFRIRVPSVSPLTGACNDFGVFELWYDAADRFTIEVVRPGGRQVTAAYGALATESDAGGFVGIDNASGGPSPDNGDHQVLIELSDCTYGGQSSGPPAGGVWTVRATPATSPSGVPVHLWISFTAYGVGDAMRGEGDNFDNGYIVSSPGTAKEVITVGAYVTRTRWRSVDGSDYRWTHEEPVGDIAFYSNGGPTRDGRLKPEITAPGTTIISAMSSAISGMPQAYIAPDSVHMANIGTSMATPQVAGAVAVMLQHDPTLTPADVRALLANSAMQDAYTANSYTGTGEAPGNPNNQWGYGKLNVRAAVEQLVDPAAIAGVLVVPDEDSITPGRTVQLLGQPFNALGDTISESVAWSSSDPTIAEVDATGLVTARGYGTAVITAAAGGRSGRAEIRVIPPVASIAISPDQATLVAGEDSVLVATPRDSAGNPLNRRVRWSSTDTLIARVDDGGRVTAVAVGEASIVAAAEEQSDTIGVVVLAPSTLVVMAEAVAPAGVTSTQKGARLVLMRLRMHVDGPEAVRVNQVGFTLTGEDPLASARLVDDRDADAEVDETDPALAGTSVALARGTETDVNLNPLSLVVPVADTTTLLLVLELSGGAPNGGTFQARYDPNRLKTTGVRSGKADRHEQPKAPIAGAPIRTTVLLPGEIFALSENPVYSDRVIFNFGERPRIAAVYTLTGARVVDLLARMESDGRVEWDLTNENGSDVAPGIYLLAFDVAGELITRKLIVVRSAGREE